MNGNWDLRRGLDALEVAMKPRWGPRNPGRGLEALVGLGISRAAIERDLGKR
jgi:hypothetical protein